MSRLTLPRTLLALGLAGSVLFAAACGSDGDASSSTDTASTDTASTEGTVEGGEATAPATSSSEPVTLRLGYFPNVTHAPAIIGVENGVFTEALGDNVELEPTTFNAGTEVVEAIFSEALDASFIGPNPAINAYAKSNGEAIRIVSGTTSGGASLVVREGIESPADLAGAKIATPSLGNTQDVALRAWLLEQGYETDTSGGGDVSITPQDNADTLAAFQAGALDGAWVPEPWATRLVLEGGGTVLVDEADLWPDGQFVTTHLIVATSFLDEHPDVIRDLIAGLGEAIDIANADPEAAQETVNAGIERITTSRLSPETIAGAWKNLTFTLDPVASSLQGSADDAATVGLLEPVDLTNPGIYDLALLNEVLAQRGDTEAKGL
jgi:NitT/TauT family transport system substrate-binding protein